MDIIRAYFPDLSDSQVKKFDKLQGLYEEWNSKINVVSRRDIKELKTRHILHSLAIARFIHFAPGTRILDIGTGGGFPGIPLAIYFPECKFTLCDSIAKKIKVVHAIAEELELENVDAQVGRVEQIEHKFDFIVSRAVAPLPQLIRWTEKKFRSDNRNVISSGWICLKGGDLIEESSETGKDFQILPIQTWFKEEFFETKRIVYVKK
jgi:16S rRNA (guanine527-N7)-methyltransferase